MVVDINSDNDFNGLKAKREAMGLSLKDVFERTRISVHYLQAIENDEFSLLPEPPYAKNFIRIYAHVLGMEEKSILGRYENYLHSLKILEGVPHEEDVGHKFSSAVISRYGIFLGIVLILLIMFVVMKLIPMQYRPSSEAGIDRAVMETSINVASEKKDITVEQKIDKVVSPGAEEEQTKAAAELAYEQAQSTTVPAAKIISPKATGGSTGNVPQTVNEVKTSRLVIKAIEETWIRMRLDRNPTFQILLKPGQEVEYKAVVFNMDIGNAGGIVIHFKGEKIENLGKPGEVISLRLP